MAASLKIYLRPNLNSIFIKTKVYSDKLKPEIQVKIPKPKIFSEFQEPTAPVQTRSGRQIKRPERYGK